MQATLLQRMDSTARRLVPFGVTLVLMLFALTPTYMPGLSHITPMYALMAVYFWTIYRPDLLGYGATFTADRRTRVGLVAIGYADGYPRTAPAGTPVARA